MRKTSTSPCVVKKWFLSVVMFEGTFIIYFKTKKYEEKSQKNIWYLIIDERKKIIIAIEKCYFILSAIMNEKQKNITFDVLSVLLILIIGIEKYYLIISPMIYKITW